MQHFEELPHPPNEVDETLKSIISENQSLINNQVTFDTSDDQIDVLKIKLKQCNDIHQFILIFQKSVKRNPCIADCKLSEFILNELIRLGLSGTLCKDYFIEAPILYECIFILNLILNRDDYDLESFLNYAIKKRSSIVIFDLLLQFKKKSSKLNEFQITAITEIFLKELEAVDVINASWLSDEDQSKIILALIENTSVSCKSRVLIKIIELHSASLEHIISICNTEIVNFADLYGYNSLHKAIQVGNYEAVEMLLLHKPNLKIRDKEDLPLMNFAFKEARKNSSINDMERFNKIINIVKLLIQCVANLSFVDAVSDNLIYLAECPNPIPGLISLLESKKAFKDNHATNYTRLPDELIIQIQYFLWETCKNFEELTNIIKSPYNKSHLMLMEKFKTQNMAEIVRLLLTKTENFYCPKSFKHYLKIIIKQKKLFWLKIFKQLPLSSYSHSFLEHNPINIFWVLGSTLKHIWADGFEFFLKNLSDSENLEFEKKHNQILLNALNLYNELQEYRWFTDNHENKINDLKKIIDLLINRGAKLNCADLPLVINKHINFIIFLIEKNLINVKIIYSLNGSGLNLLDNQLQSILERLKNTKFHKENRYFKDALTRWIYIAKSFTGFKLSEYNSPTLIKITEWVIHHYDILENKEKINLLLELIQVLTENFQNNPENAFNNHYRNLMFNSLPIAVYSKNDRYINYFLNQLMMILEPSEYSRFISNISQEKYLQNGKINYLILLKYNIDVMLDIKKKYQNEHDQNIKPFLESFIYFLNRNLASQPSQIVAQWKSNYLKYKKEDPFHLCKLKNTPTNANSFSFYSSTTETYQQWFDNYLLKNPQPEIKEETRLEKQERNSFEIRVDKALVLS